MMTINFFGSKIRSTVAFVTILAACQVAAAQSARCEPSKASEKYPTYAKGTVKIGINSTYPPFSYSDPNDMKKMAGLDVDIVESAMKCAGLKYEYINGQHPGLYSALFSGSHDVMIGNVFFRPDRAEKASFVLFMINAQSLVVRKGNPKGVKSTETMCGLTASGSFNSSSARLVQDISKRCTDAGKAAINWIPAQDHEPAYRSLANDRIDMVMDGSVSAMLRQRSADGRNFDIAFTVPSDVKSGMIVTKGNKEILKVMGDGIIELEKTGQLAELMKKHGLQTDWLIPVEVIP
jgi:polar amino acid transport system substrate-binding protein